MTTCSTRREKTRFPPPRVRHLRPRSRMRNGSGSRVPHMVLQKTNASTVVACCPAIATCGSARIAASRKKATSSVPRAAVRSTSAGPTASRAGSRPASNDGPLKTYRIAVIAGDGIGPEVIEAAIPILDRVAAKHAFAIYWERLHYSADHYLKTVETLPDAAFHHLRDDVDAIFLGALGDPRVPGNEHARDILLGLRFRPELRSERH